MAHLIVEENVIGVLSADTLPAAVGGGPNPFKNLIEFLDKTRGRWLHQNETKGGRSGFERLVANEFGVAPIAGRTIYKSPYFDAARLPVAVIPQAMGMFAAMGLSFELIQFPAFIQLADQQYDNQTPSYLPNSRITNEDETITKVTWDAWKDATHNHLSIDGQNYVPLNSNTGGHDLAGSVLVQLINGGYNVQSMAAWPVIESEEL
jgi:hypothetical protein